MSKLKSKREHAAFDVVGKYDQDSINGFDATLLDRFIELAKLENANSILDLMGGDGNLSARLFDFCERKGKKAPQVTVFEYSATQCEFARYKLKGRTARVINGDATSMESFEDGERLPDNSFDRVFIKSANHEIPLEQQIRLYSEIFRVLRPGGMFLNLGFCMESTEERDELREIARCKDSLAGMQQAVVNRHFLTRQELYQALTDAGFINLNAAESFQYRINSAIVSEHYFKSKERNEFDANFQATQARCMNLRRAQRIVFESDTSTMYLPGEVTIARKPNRVDENETIFEKYPYEMLRKVDAHRELLAKATEYISQGSTVLDVGCGVGLLAERLVSRVDSYVGIDLATKSIQICQETFRENARMTFSVQDMNDFDFGADRWDAVLFLNSLYVQGVDVHNMLANSYEALKAGGTVVVSGPLSRASYERAEPKIAEQLERDGVLEKYPDLLEGLRLANARLLTESANYYSAEGMVELLRLVGFEQFLLFSSGLYYGNAYLVVAKK